MTHMPPPARDQGAFTLGGTFSVLVVGAGFGAAVALDLLPRLDWAERAEPLLLLPLALAFGALLQAATWRWRRVSNA